MKLKRPTSDDSIEHMKRDFAFDFENQNDYYNDDFDCLQRNTSNFVLSQCADA